MAGFDKEKVKRNSVEFESEDFDVDMDLDIEDDELEGNFIPPTPTPKGKSTKKPVPRKPQKKEDNNLKIILGVIGGLVVISALAIGSFMLGSSDAEEPVAEEPVIEDVTKTQKPDGNVGVPNLHGVGAVQNDSQPVNSKEILKDITGTTVPTNYKVETSEIVTDFINYEKFRAITGTGLEFYWLEAEYKGQKYKVQVPYSIFSKLDAKGITVVDAEVLSLEGGSKMVTYMQVRKDAKDLLEQRR